MHCVVHVYPRVEFRQRAHLAMDPPTAASPSLGRIIDSNCLRVQPNADSAARLESVLRPLHDAAMQWLSKTLTRAVSLSSHARNSRNRLMPTIVTHTNSFKRTPP